MVLPSINSLRFQHSDGAPRRSFESVSSRIDIAFVSRSTRTLPRPYRQACNPCRTRLAPTFVASLGGTFAINLNVFAPAGRGLVRKHSSKLIVPRTGDTLTKSMGYALDGIDTKNNLDIFSNKAPRQLVIPILALVANPFLQSGSKPPSLPALRLCKS